MICVTAKTYGQIRDEIWDLLRTTPLVHDSDETLWDTLEYFDVFMVDAATPWPAQWAWIASYVLGEEHSGHYIHVEILQKGGTRIAAYLGRTRVGIDAALAVSNALTKALVA